MDPARRPAEAQDAREDPREQPGRPRARRRRLLLPGAAVLVVVAVVAAVLLLRAPAPLPGPAPVALPVDALTRDQMVQRLQHDGDAGIAAYTVVHRAPRAIRNASAAEIDEEHGRGPGSFEPAFVPDQPALDSGAGEATVYLVVDAAARVRWQVLGLGATDGGAVVTHPLATQDADLTAGRLIVRTFAYRASDRPQAVRVDVPDGVDWGAAILLTD